MPATTGMAPIARKASPQAITAVPITGGFVAAMAALPKVDRIVDLQTDSNKNCWPHRTASPPKAHRGYREAMLKRGLTAA